METAAVEDFISELKILRVIVYKHRHTHRRSDHLHGLQRLQKWSEKYLECPDEGTLEELKLCAVMSSCKLGGLIAHGHFLNYSLMSLAMIARLVTRAERMVRRNAATNSAGSGLLTTPTAGAGVGLPREDIDCGVVVPRGGGPGASGNDGSDNILMSDFGEAIVRKKSEDSSSDDGEVIERPKKKDDKKGKDLTEPSGFEFRGDSDSESEEKRKKKEKKEKVCDDTRGGMKKKKTEKDEGSKTRGSFEIRGEESDSEEKTKKDESTKEVSRCEIVAEKNTEGQSDAMPSQRDDVGPVPGHRDRDAKGDALARRPEESSNKKRRKRRKRG